MKLAIAALLVTSAAAFAPVAQPAFRVNALSAIITGSEGKAAPSAEKDLELTREVIRIFMGDDSEEESTAEEEE